MAPDIDAVAPRRIVGELDRRLDELDHHGRSAPRRRGRPSATGQRHPRRFLDRQDVADHTAVAVLGSTTASELFSGVDPVGQTVDVDGIP